MYVKCQNVAALVHVKLSGLHSDEPTALHMIISMSISQHAYTISNPLFSCHIILRARIWGWVLITIVVLPLSFQKSGSDRTRKMKLINAYRDKQKTLRMIGNIQVPREAFIEVLKEKK